MTNRLKQIVFLVQLLLLTTIYFAAAQWGLTLASMHTNVSPVWPPTGIAIAAVLLMGYRAWPGILLGAFLANYFTPAPIATAAGIAIGNTLEAMTAAVILRSIGFHNSFDRAKDVAWFVGAAVAGTIVSATVGNVSLRLGRVATWQNFGSLWMTWWLGDLVGAFALAPLLLTWADRSGEWRTKMRYLEAALLLIFLSWAASVTFGTSAPTPLSYYPLSRLIVPFFLYASFRLGQRGITLATIVLSAFALWGTAHGLGPFVSPSRTANEALLQLQLFIGTNAITFLFLAAVVQERRTSKEDLERVSRLPQENPAPVLRLDQGRVVSYANSAARRMLASWGVVLGEEAPAEITEVAEAALTGGDKREIEIVLGERTYTVTFVPVAQARYVNLYFGDITERKRAEEERERLLINEQAARIELEKANALIGRLQTITETALHNLGMKELLDEMLERVRETLKVESVAILLRTEDGRHLTLAAGVGLEKKLAGDVRIPFGRGIAGRIAATREPLLVDDLSKVEVQNPILRENIASLVGVPLLVEQRLIGVLHADSVTPRRFSQDDARFLQLVADRIALAIDHVRLYEAEQEARIFAERANRMKDEFLATVSHELRTPLNAIVGWCAMLQAGHLDAATSKRAIEVIDRNAKMQTQLIEDILDVSRIITGKLRLDMKPVQLAHVIESAVDSISPAASSKSISIQLMLDSNTGPVSGDADRLQQIVWNLLANAVKFTPARGEVWVKLRTVDAYAEITVRDSGPGIPADFLPYVFDRFRQADSTITRKYGGLGLGLAIARHLVELHGGSISAESDGEKEGATFVVTLPLLTGAIEARDTGETATILTASKIDPYVKLTGLKVLIVDDESEARELLTTMLARFEADVKGAESAAEGLIVLSEWKPDVLIADIEMPNVDGYAFIRQVRALDQQKLRRTPAVAVTAYARAEDRLKALEAGFQFHIPKPVEPLDLAMIVASLTLQATAKMSAVSAEKNRNR
jgi:signal transduction histidine kinase/integral membrane sensor domain MASE1/ActR/RegA family two-component response regulator